MLKVIPGQIIGHAELHGSFVKTLSVLFILGEANIFNANINIFVLEGCIFAKTRTEIGCP